MNRTNNACTCFVAKPSPYDNPNHPPNSEFPPGSGRKTYWALVNLLSKESLSLRRSSASLGSRGAGARHHRARHHRSHHRRQTPALHSRGHHRTPTTPTRPAAASSSCPWRRPHALLFVWCLNSKDMFLKLKFTKPKAHGVSDPSANFLLPHQRHIL